MQFSLVALAVLATGVSAVPLSPLFNRAGTCNIDSTSLGMGSTSFYNSFNFQPVSLLSRHLSPRRATLPSRKPEPVRTCADYILRTLTYKSDTPFNTACLAAAAKGTAAFVSFSVPPLSMLLNICSPLRVLHAPPSLASPTPPITPKRIRTLQMQTAPPLTITLLVLALRPLWVLALAHVILTVRPSECAVLRSQTHLFLSLCHCSRAIFPHGV